MGTMTTQMKHNDLAGFSPSMKLADLIEMNFTLLDVLSRFGIGLGFGDNTIREVCRKHGIDLNSFLLICKIYNYEDFVPSAEMLENAVAEDVVKYLHSSHQFYLSSDIDPLEKDLGRLMEPCDAAQKKVISKFFADYKKEVENHFAYEENTVFPYIEALSRGERTEGYSIEQFEENHSNIDEKLGDMKNIVMKYLPDECDTVLRNNVLRHLFVLEIDLSKHTAVENNVLIPLVGRMEAEK